MRKTISSMLTLLLFLFNMMTVAFAGDLRETRTTDDDLTTTVTWEPTDDMPHISTPDENDIAENEAIDIAKQTLTDKFGYASTYFDDSEIHCGFYMIPLEYSEYDCEEIWRVELIKQEMGSSPFTVEMSGQGHVLMYKAPTTMPYYGNEAVLAEAKTASHTLVDATEEQVISELRSCMYELGDFSDYDVTSLRIETHFIYHERFCYGKEPVWYSEIYQDDEQIGKAVSGFDGSFMDIATRDQEITNTIRNGYWEGIANDFDMMAFWKYSLEEKAAFSREWIPYVQERTAVDPYFAARNDLLFAATRHVYGLPGEHDITLAAAEATAKQAAIALGADPTNYQKRRLESLFDVTDANTPLWKIVIFGAEVDSPTVSDCLRFRVIINANTGDVLEQYIIDGSMDVIDWRM